MNVKRESEKHLAAYEKAAASILRLRKQFPDVFAAYDGLSAEQERVLTELKAVFHDTCTPPAGLPTGERSKIWARGASHFVQVQYKLRAPYYNPAKLPSWAFDVKGVVVKVDTLLVTELAHDDKSHPGASTRLNKALVTDEWMTPAVLVKART